MKFRSLEWFATPAVLEGHGCATGLVSVTGVYLAVGLAAFVAWRVTGDFVWVGNYFRVPGALLTVFLAGAQFWFARRALTHFSSGEPMRRAWMCISASAAFDFTGAILIQILAKDSALNPLSHILGWPAASRESIRHIGLLLGGTCRFTILCLGLWYALRAYRRSGLLGRLNAVNWLALAAMGAYIVIELSEIGGALRRSNPIPLSVVAGWPVDPFLWLLLAQAMLLYRSARQMGPGWITRCWNAMAVGIFLVLLGDVVKWAANWGYLPWPWSAVEWYIWPIAAAAFALAPAYQLEAIQRASQDEAAV